MSLRVRPARATDAAAIAGIYAPIVEETHISFELTPPSVDEMRRRVAQLGRTHPFLVCERHGEVVGYAYAGPFRGREGYRFTVELSVYVRADGRRMGVGRGLLVACVDFAALLGHSQALACIALPNPASVSLFESEGFSHAGTLARVGQKLGAFHDVGWWQRTILDAPDARPHPAPAHALEGTESFAAVLARGAAMIAG